MRSPILVQLSGQRLHSSSADALNTISALVGRHDVLRASFFAPPPLQSLSLQSEEQTPYQIVSAATTQEPLYLKLDKLPSDQFPGELFYELCFDAYVASGGAFLPIVVALRDGWASAAMVSHLAIDGAGAQILEEEYSSLRERDIPVLPRAVEIREVVELESAAKNSESSQRNLSYIDNLLRAASRSNLVLPRDPFPVAEVATLSSSRYAGSMEKLSESRVGKATITSLVFCAFLGLEFGRQDVVMRSFFRAISPFPKTRLVAPHALHAYIRIITESGGRFSDLLARAQSAVLTGYGAAKYSPVDVDALHRRVAKTLGAEMLDAIPGLNYLPSKSARQIPQDPEEMIWNTSMERLPLVPLPMIAGLAVFENSTSDKLSLLGGGWSQFRDSLHFLLSVELFVQRVAEDPTLVVDQLVRESRDLAR